MYAQWRKILNIKTIQFSLNSLSNYSAKKARDAVYLLSSYLWETSFFFGNWSKKLDQSNTSLDKFLITYLNVLNSTTCQCFTHRWTGLCLPVAHQSQMCGPVSNLRALHCFFMCHCSFLENSESTEYLVSISVCVI